MSKPLTVKGKKFLFLGIVLTLLMNVTSFLAVWVNDNSSDAATTVFAFLAIEFFFGAIAAFVSADNETW